LINELGYLMDDAGGVTVACEDVTSFNECDDRVMMCSEDLSERSILLIVLVNLVQSQFTFGSVHGRFGKRLCDRLNSVEVGKKE